MAVLNAKNITYGLLHLFSVLVAVVIVSLIPILHSSELKLPATYAAKTTQQIVNFAVVLFAIGIGLMMKYCLSITNEAETASELGSARLSLARLQVHSNVTKQSSWSILKAAWYDPSIRSPARFYLFALATFGGITWVLSIIFVLEYGRGDQPIQKLVGYSLSADIPSQDDACSLSITAANCTYDLAISALSSQLITHAPYTISSIQFLPPFGTQGLPYSVLEQFSFDVDSYAFGGRLVKQYCLPVLDYKTVFCEQDPLSSRAAYEYLGHLNDFAVYNVTINPDTPYSDTHIRVSFQNGTMTVAQSADPSEPQVTIITATDIYADILSQLTYGYKSTSTIFTVACTIKTLSSWQWVTLTYINGNYQVTKDLGISYCTSDQGNNYTGFKDLFYAIEGATRLVNAIDGYSKYLNDDITGATFSTLGNDTQELDSSYAMDSNMTLLESILSQMYEIVQTSYSSTNREIATRTPITEVSYQNIYIITVSWTAASLIALLVALLIFAATLSTAIRWLRAGTCSPQQERSRWKLLEVVDLMSYSAKAALDINNVLATEKDREEASKGKKGLVLNCLL